MKTENEKSGNFGNTNAKKSEAEKASAMLHARVTQEQKNRYVRQAQNEGMKLTEWIKLKLDSASEGAFD